jgi:hypothetical protein
MVDFKDRFKSFADKAQQKITDIQNDEKLREAVSGVVKQAQEKLTEVKKDEKLKGLIEQGKEKVGKLRNGSQQASTEIEQSHISSSASANDVTIDLTSSSGNCQTGESKWTPSSGQGLSFIFLSELGIRAVSGAYPFCNNKLALYFKDMTLLALQEKEYDIIFTFLGEDSTKTTLSFLCSNKSNCQKLRQFIISHAHAIAPELEASKIKIQQNKTNLETLINYLQTNQDKVVFQQLASYRGGLPGYPSSTDKPGRAYILGDSIIFHDEQISWHIAYNKVIGAELDFFQLRGSRAFFAGGNVGRMLQEVKNTVAVTYLDTENIERTVKFQIHGAATIPGEGVKAQEFLNHLLDFKKSFLKKEEVSAANQNDPLSTLKKLKELKDQGVISESEFEAKKQSILQQL